jgi:DNA polymerase
VPRPDEVAACLPYLRRQIDAIDPQVIVTLGRPATLALLGRTESITQLRGRVYRWEGRAVVPTFHPAYLLRNPAAKPDAWRDIQLAMRELGLPIPPPPKRGGPPP